MRAILMLNSKQYHQEYFADCLSLVKHLLSSTESFKNTIKQQQQSLDTLTNLKKGLVIFWMNGGHDVQQRQMVVDLFSEEFKD